MHTDDALGVGCCCAAFYRYAKHNMHSACFLGPLKWLAFTRTCAQHNNLLPPRPTTTSVSSFHNVCGATDDNVASTPTGGQHLRVVGAPSAQRCTPVGALHTMNSETQSAMGAQHQGALPGPGDTGATPNPSTAVVATGDQAGPSMEIDRTKHPSGIVPVLQNLVATVNMGCQLELKTIALSARNAEYNPKVHFWKPMIHSLCIACQYMSTRVCNSVLRRSSCASATPRPRRSSLRRARWSSLGQKVRNTAASLHARCGWCPTNGCPCRFV